MRQNSLANPAVINLDLIELGWTDAPDQPRRAQRGQCNAAAHTQLGSAERMRLMDRSSGDRNHLQQSLGIGGQSLDPGPEHCLELDAGRGVPIIRQSSSLQVFHKLVDEQRVACRFASNDMGLGSRHSVVAAQQSTAPALETQPG